MWFANPDTLYVADEGNGTNTYSSTVSGGGDQGADPNKLYVITDRLSNTSAAVAAEETFTDIRDAVGGEVLRGVSFTPGTPVTSY